MTTDMDIVWFGSIYTTDEDDVKRPADLETARRFMQRIGGEVRHEEGEGTYGVKLPSNLERVLETCWFLELTLNDQSRYEPEEMGLVTLTIEA